jgi:transposase
MRGAPGRARGYPSDLTDAQWQLIAPHLPADRPGRRGRPRIVEARRIVEATLYLDRTGCAWRCLPCDFPPWKTVYCYFAAWPDDGTLTRPHDALRAQVRTAAGGTPSRPPRSSIPRPSGPRTPCRRRAGAGTTPRRPTAVILSSVFDHGCDLLRCDVDGIVDGPGLTSAQQDPMSFGVLRFGVSRLPVSPRTSAALR